ncbi:iron-sulfur assembly protein 1 [Histoplasma capsulatum G186AR]|uniref:Iron-sulfur assembly protein 1 n=1 Tax=Ajellomyces capsulatus (strain G186AR / H82 / ATCC MYA-2454 / RMSCC 2432) TaxID=447093 RepID=C0NK46_AJECG|nr:iron-sulfur assembly protein 1 [Histoplasma capsulatum G186AR]EEH08237.1 iron-sulfur assembly protein 1 [Histoplasma capsulatum G186AR]
MLGKWQSGSTNRPHPQPQQPESVESINKSNATSYPEVEAQLVRVGVKNRGCSGLSYHLEYVDKPAPFDEVVEQDGVKILIDSKALFSIIGTEMDWQEDSLASRFVFKNPNIKDQCGCGESFMV